jgi:hypothetical protein
MSYINMDHAGWVESNIAAYKRQKPTARDRRHAAEHRGWFAAPDQLNPFQRRAFTILGIVGGGIYNAPIGWDGLTWDSRYIICSWRKGFGTFDFSDLTRFVFLCHEARIRGHIGPSGPGLLEVALHERAAAGGMATRHPNLDEVYLEWRQLFPAGHSVIYRETSVPQPANEAGETMTAGASAASSPALLAPAEPGGCEGGCGHAPEVYLAPDEDAA